MPSRNDYLSISEAARLLGVSRVTVWRWISAGRIPAARLSHRTVRIAREDLEGLLSRSTYPGADGGRATQPGWADMGDSDHFVQFYETDSFLVASVSGFIGAALQAGDAGIVIATEEHRALIESKLRADGLDLAAARAGERYFSLDASSTLSTFMVNGVPDAGLFGTYVGGVIARAGGSGRKVRAFGEMVALLTMEGNDAGAIRLEQHWNDLQQRHSFALFCAYPMRGLAGAAHTGLLSDVCLEHSRVIPTESYLALSTPDEQFREIAALQQKALALEAAVASESAARARAEDALQARVAFLEVAAHELKTPVTSVKSAAQLGLRRLAQGAGIDPVQMPGLLRMIVRQTDKLSRLINQLLQASHLDSGGLPLQREPADLVPLCREAVAMAQGWSEDHVISLTAPPSLDATVDSWRFELLLLSLLDNAVRFSPSGLIEVDLSGPSGDLLQLSVRDHGIGIPAGQGERIFERFSGAHTTDHLSGLGLGLAISREIAELHGGRIRTESPPDGGTRFVVTLPTAPLEAT